MFRDVTFGQYYLADSFVHKMDARVKLLLTLLFMVGIFFVKSFVVFGFVAVYLLTVILIARVPLRSVFKSIKGIIVLLVLTAVINILFTKGANDAEQPLWSWSPWNGFTIEIYANGLIKAGKLFLRLVMLVMGSSILTLTTTPVDLTHAVESLLKPLRIIRFPVHEFALIMSLTLSFIPSLIEETDRIIRAQKARGADFDTGGLVKRAKAFVPILIPLLVGGFRRAEELANAMNSRCYEGATKRTCMRVMKLSWRDFVAGFVAVAFFTGVFLLYGMAKKWGDITWLYY